MRSVAQLFWDVPDARHRQASISGAPVAGQQPSVAASIQRKRE
jgi:hypothetical protein